MFGGELIHEISDESGRIQVVEYFDQLRSLHFNTATQQSAMLLKNPFFLPHKYTQAMMLPLALLPVERVLMAGLGGGSMVRYILNYFTTPCISCFESREAVIQLAREFFLLDTEHERLSIINQDFLYWLQEGGQNESYDLLMMDMFYTRNGVDYTVDIFPQLESLLSIMSDHGVLVINQLKMRGKFLPVLDRLADEAEIKALYKVEIEASNSIYLACKQPFPVASNKKLSMLEFDCALPFRTYYDALERIK